MRKHDNDIAESGRGDSKCILAGMLVGDKWLKYLEADRRVYDSYGLCPTVRTVTGGE